MYHSIYDTSNKTKKKIKLNKKKNNDISNIEQFNKSNKNNCLNNNIFNFYNQNDNFNQKIYIYDNNPKSNQNSSRSQGKCMNNTNIKNNIIINSNNNTINNISIKNKNNYGNYYQHN
jgi:hypothetical protein